MNDLIPPKRYLACASIVLLKSSNFLCIKGNPSGIENGTKQSCRYAVLSRSPRPKIAVRGRYVQQQRCAKLCVRYVYCWSPFNQDTVIQSILEEMDTKSISTFLVTVVDYGFYYKALLHIFMLLLLSLSSQFKLYGVLISCTTQQYNINKSNCHYKTRFEKFKKNTTRCYIACFCFQR